MDALGRHFVGLDRCVVATGATFHGDWMNREFQVKDQAGRVAIVVSRAWFSIHDGYGIQITPGFEVPLGLAIVIALERVEVQEQGEQSSIQNLLGGIGPF